MTYTFAGETTNVTEHVLYLMSTVHEAIRVSNKCLLPPKVYPYSRHTYDGAPGYFYSKVSE